MLHSIVYVEKVNQETSTTCVWLIQMETIIAIISLLVYSRIQKIY